MALQDLTPAADTDEEVSGELGFETSANDTEGDYHIVDPASSVQEETAEETTEEETSEPNTETEETVSEGEETTEEVPGDEPDAGDGDVTEEPEQSGLENISPELLEQAGQLGFRYEDVKELGSEGALRVAVQRQMALVNETMRLQQQFQAEQNQQQKPEEKPDETPSASDELRAKLQEMREDPSGFDPKLMGYLEAVLARDAANDQRMQELTRQAQQQKDALEKQLSAVQQQALQGEAQKAVDWFDTQIAALPESYQKRLGTGPSLAMNQMTTEYQNRERLSRIALNFRQNWNEFGFSGADDPRIVSSAAAAAFGEDAKTQARQELKEQLRENGKQVTSRPTHTQTVPQDPDEKAAQFADRHPLFQR